MIIQGKHFSCLVCMLVAFLFAGGSDAAMPINPRTNDSGSSPRSSINENISRRAMSSTRVRSVIPARVTGTARGALTNSATRSPVSSTRVRVRSGAAVPATVSRIARTAKPSVARSGKNILNTPVLSRSATARATALFQDVSKIGYGYASCRESYATCMDQICGQANDTYRRCFCSSRFTQFRDVENALDKAMIMLQQFQDNNLEAIDKTAAEVNAMYSATVGEQAIKKDTSASAKMLDEINNLLSGKSSSSTSSYSSGSSSVGILDLSFSDDTDDIWSGGGTDSIFGLGGGKDLSTLEGAALFNEAQKQCSRVSKASCENDAVFSMSKSSYNILITQDCNAYEKTVNKKRETVAQAIRSAEKYLREARLEEYRSHNSADVNECIARVRESMLDDTACGENYKRCLDPTGAYINGATGAPILSPRLFKLEETIKLTGNISGDVLADNQDYNKHLDSYRTHVVKDLDSCRDIAEYVWTEFKRNAIIEIAQAQTAKIEEAKASCVDTMAKCYNTQSQQIVDMDQKTAVAAGTLGRTVARHMCKEEVMACATVWSRSNEGCTVDDRGHISNGDRCGLQSLLDYVDMVDSINVVEKCEEAIAEHITELCTPDDQSYSYPYKCKNLNRDSLRTNIQTFANANCKYQYDNDTGLGSVANQITTSIQTAVDDLTSAMRTVLGQTCESLGGHWYGKNKDGNQIYPSAVGSDENPILFSQFYNDVYGRGTAGDADEEWGLCYENTRRDRCEAYNDDYIAVGDDGVSETVATWDEGREECRFSNLWYKDRCELIGGYYDKNTCYVAN